jgi:hypothetical protein
MLAVPADELGDPVLFFVEMKSADRLHHDRSLCIGLIVTQRRIVAQISRKTRLMRPCLSSGLGAGEKPNDEAQHRQKNDEQCPQHLLAGRRAALKDVDDRPNIGGKDDQAPQSIHVSKHDDLLKVDTVGNIALRYIS